jgi:hypothetical protein
MSAERDVNRIVRSWLSEVEHDSADRILQDVLALLDTTPQRRSWWPARRDFRMNLYAKLAAAAAAVAVVAVLGFNILGGRGTPGAVATPPSTGNPTASALPTAAPTTAPTPASAEPTRRPFPEVGPLEPGDYLFTSVAPLEITFTVFEAGWVKNVIPNTIWSSNSAVRFGFGIVSNVLADPCVPGVEVDPPVGPTVDDLATALATLPGVEPVTPSDVELGGFRGKLVDLRIPESAEPCEGMWISDDEGGRIRYWILDVEGTRLVITAVERPGNPTLGTRLEQILDSVRIETQ